MLVIAIFISLSLFTAVCHMRHPKKSDMNEMILESVCVCLLKQLLRNTFKQPEEGGIPRLSQFNFVKISRILKAFLIRIYFVLFFLKFYSKAFKSDYFNSFARVQNKYLYFLNYLIQKDYR
jgi:hypothetical protein